MARGSSEDEVYLDIDFEHFLSKLYGKRNYHQHSGFYSTSEFKKDLQKIRKSVTIALEININSDAGHKERLEWALQRFDRSLANKNGIDYPNLIQALLEIIFEVMGGVPDNWDHRVTNKSIHWKANRYRSMIYSQNCSQKANIIIDHLPVVESKEIPNQRSLYEKRWKLNNDEIFVAWFKEHYSQIYLEIF